MRVSFDIDDTLVLHSLKSAPMESGRFPRFICRWLGEPLRLGTRALIQRLRERGCSIWIYTSSNRTPFHIWIWLFLYGISADGVVNDERHRRELLRRIFPRLPSKYPPAFDIDLHVDDSDGVRLEGLEHGFDVVIVNPDDPSWTEKVLDAVDAASMRPSRVKLSPAADSTPPKARPAPR